MCYIAAELQNSKSPTKGFILSKREGWSGLKRLIQTHPHMSTSRFGNIFIMLPKCSRKKRRRGFSKRSSVDVVMPGRHCVSRRKQKSTLFGLPKVDAIRNHWLRFVYNRTAQPKCSNLCNAFYGRQFREPRRVQGWLCKKNGSFWLFYDNLALLNQRLQVCFDISLSICYWLFKCGVISSVE